MKEYKKLHIIKHALEMYIVRDGASELDIRQEIQVLTEVTKNIEQLKEEYDIESK